MIETPEPTWEAGIPFCAESCTFHDGKRCTKLGAQPATVCEPAVKLLSATLERFVSSGDPCHYDHHGYCQSHLLGENPCEHEVAKDLLGVEQ